MTSTSKKNQSKLKTAVATAALFIIGFFFGMGITNVAKAQDSDNSLLWKISGNGLEKPSYLYGTIHITCEETFGISEEMKKAFEATELTVLELDMDDPNLPVIMQQNSVNPGMANISDKLSDEDKDIINAFFTEKYGADLSQFGVVKPFFLISMVTLKTVTCASKSYEQTFVEMSKEAGREVKGLETAEFQTTILDDVSQEQQLEWLRESIVNFDEQVDLLERMMQTHKSNDMKKLFEMITADPQFVKYIDLMLFDRNKDWISKMEKTAKEQPTFFAVGAGHLGSDQGVVALLQKEGYTLEAIH